MKRSVIGGKVMRTPEYDEKSVGPMSSGKIADLVVADINSRQFKAGLYADEDRTWARDKALLVSLGVDGDVPLAQARVNAGLDKPTFENASPYKRGSGNTAKQLLSLQPGDVFIVAQGAQADYTRRLLAYLRGREFAEQVRILPMSGRSESHRLMGWRGRAVIDHAYRGLVTWETYEGVRAMADQINSRHPANDNELAVKAA